MLHIAAFHPQIVHFVVALAVVGALLRWISLTGKLAFTRPAAATLLILGAGAAVAAVESGSQAHERAERIPGVRSAVQAHEDAGEWARDALLVVAGLEIAGLALSRRAAWRRWAEVASGVACLAAVGAVYEAADRGGDLVYSYVGGPGLRTGDTADVHRLLTAGLYEEAMLARNAHRSAEADSLISELARRDPASVEVQLVAAQSLMTDRKDPRAALAALDRIAVPDTEPFTKMRVAFARADVYAAAGMKDSARAVLEGLAKQFPDNPRIRQRVERLK
ncbi:MAG TPA: DUF2231 domain-containing protein [Gemmatimonadales bacterium]|nr:DUF2231 domain-containing protein [Gemmatimonadales bacterium]